MFAISGILILSQPKEKLAAKMPFVNDHTPAMVKIVALAHLAGSLGLVLPMSLGIAPIMTPVAASCLSLVMILAARYNLIRKDTKSVLIDLVICALFITIAILRFKQA